MHKNIRHISVLGCLFIYFSTLAQNPQIYKDETYDFNFISSFTIKNFSLGFQNYTDPYYNKDTLTGTRMLETSVANEFGLKGLKLTEENRHGFSLEANSFLIIEGKTKSIDFTGIPDSFTNKITKRKGFSLIVLLKDINKEKNVWAGWISIENMKEKNVDFKIEKGIRLIIENYP